MSLFTTLRKALRRQSDATGASGGQRDEMAERLASKLTPEERRQLHSEIAADPRVEEALKRARAEFPQFRST